MQLLQDRVALITGAGHGQGRSHAVRLAQEGADVVLIDSCGPAPAGVAYPLATEDELAETADLVRAAGRRALIRTADVRDFDQLAAAVSDSLNEFGRLDVVVANAGIISYNLTWEIPEPAWDAVINTNLKGVWNTFRATVPAMIEQQTGGSIIAVSSVAGLKGYALMSHYTASKFAVVGMVKVLALELAEHGIRVNTVNPTGVGADLSTGWGADSFMTTRASDLGAIFATYPHLTSEAAILRDPESPRDGALHKLPVIEPIDVSNAVLWLASDQSRYVTGIHLPVDGGALTR
jgi:(+)-trans-carveol dehydrogenase